MQHTRDWLEFTGRVLDGDDDTGEELADIMEYLVKVLCAKRGVKVEDSRHLVGDVMADFLGAGANGIREPKLRKYSGKCDLRTFLVKVVLNAHSDQMRRRKFRGDFPQPKLDEGEYQEPCDCISDDKEEGKFDSDFVELVQASIREALQSLSPDYRTILALYYISGLGQTEISKMLMISQVLVSRMLQDARSIIRRSIRASMGQSGESVTFDECLEISKSQLLTVFH